MNWLAHLHLSGDSPEARIGNLLPDILNATELLEVPASFLHGIRLHKSIDAFTDSHAIFRRSAARIEAPMRRYRGILVDLFYDHFLAREWPAYSPIPLFEFVRCFHESLDHFRSELPPSAFTRLIQIRDAGYLLSYHETQGIGIALERLGHRLRKPVDLRHGVDALLSHYQEFEADFRSFYPQLVRHATDWVGQNTIECAKPSRIPACQ